MAMTSLMNDRASRVFVRDAGTDGKRTMDAVSDVLRFVRLSGAVYLNGEFSSPWCLYGQTDTPLREYFMPGVLPHSERVVSYHLITEGRCWAWLPDDPGAALQVEAGELLVVPQGEPHVMGSARDLPPVQGSELLHRPLRASPGDVMKVHYGGGGDATRMLCGFLACDETLDNPVLAALPRLFKLDMRNDPHSAWLESSLKFAAIEAAQWRAGSATVLARLSELLFVEAVRRCIDSLPPDRKGWLAAVRDRFVGRALAVMHAQPAHCWTVDELARKVGLSRSALAQRFTELLGQPPMQYLASWRLMIAAQELVTGTKTLAAIAQQVGYDSEAAFNRAFKREFGMPPAGWRKSRAKSARVAEADEAVAAAEPN